MPFTVNVHEKPALFGRFNAVWTPTILVLNGRAAELRRIEGYLPRDMFVPELELGAAKAEFVAKQFDTSEKQFEHVAKEHAFCADEATYWRAVSKYSGSHDPSWLRLVADELREKFPNSVWTAKASVWRGE